MEEHEYHFWDNDYLEEAYRPPMLVTLVFVLAMLAIYFMGRTVTGFYDAADGLLEPMAQLGLG